MATDRLVSLASTVYVIEPAKVLYVKASKSACTTMLWTIIDLAGIDPATIGFAARDAADPEMFMIADTAEDRDAGIGSNRFHRHDHAMTGTDGLPRTERENCNKG